MSSPTTRREFLRVSTGVMILAMAPIATATILPTMRVASDAQPLTLTTLGDARSLPPKILGASAEPLIEHLLDDPRKIAAIKETAPAIIRFPGGSQSNYYNWRDGLLHFDPQPNSSEYYKFWANAAPRIAQAFPNGISYEQYFAFATQIGDADVVLVPNLETSSIDEQVAWFKKLASENILTREIELGNEFWVAMAGDPNVMRVWPNAKYSMEVMHRYEQALRPLIGAGAQFAVQASAASFVFLPNDTRPFVRRLLQWDQDLAPAEWFEAVTAHLYPNPSFIAAEAGNPSPSELFSLLMGRSDAGVDRALNDVAKRVPGKEIWVTEWNPRGGSFADLNQPERDKVTPPMNAQLITRTTLAMLRHPEVTKSLYFTLYSTNGSALQTYVQAGNQFVPMAPAVVLRWFNDAANGGSSFQRVVEANDRPISGLGPFKESYHPIEGGLFHSDKRTVLILQNASTEARRYDPTDQGAKPARVEMLVASDFGNTAHIPAQVTPLDPNAPLVLPSLSIARVIWE